MPLIVISDPVYFKGESSLINLLFNAGLHIFHLRKPDTDILNYKELIAGIDTKYHDRIALHQFHELCADFPLIKRIHYPEQLRKSSFEADSYNLDHLVLSTSVHQLSDLKELKGFDYTFYGPVYNSISKLGYTGLSKADLVLPDQNKSLKIIGLGGINHQNLKEAKQMGFHGVAVLGAIWNDQSAALTNYKKLLIKYKNYFN